MKQSLQRRITCTNNDCPGGEVRPCTHKDGAVLRCLGCNTIKVRGMTA